MRFDSKSLKIGLLYLIALSFSSCSWSILLVVANSSDGNIKVTYKINEKEFYKNPKTYSFDKKILNLYKKNTKKRPQELPNDSEYNDEFKTVTLTVKPGEASIIGDFGSFESFEEEIMKGELEVLLENDSVIHSKDAVMLFEHWNKKAELMEIK